MTVQKLSDGRYRNKTTGKVADSVVKLQDAGDNKAEIIALSKSVTALREQLKYADTAQRAIASSNRTKGTIDIEDISGFGIAMDKIQKEAKRAESVLKKLARR